jgi:hypothetical protein
MNLLITLITCALLLTVQHPAMPKGVAHEEHTKQIERETRR